MASAQATFPALGSIAVVVVDDAERLAEARTCVERVIDAFDRACSRFRDDSELSRLAHAQGRPVAVSQLLFDAVSAALRAARVTDGDVDPTLGAALRGLGYDRDFDALARRGPARVRIAAIAGWRAVRLEPQPRTITVPPGVELDLGATAKALAADRAAAAAHEAIGGGVLVSLGGDIALAGEAPAAGWQVRVTDDHRSGADAPGQTIAVRTGGLATSSTQVRRWSTESGEAHHLLDPRTGQPVSGDWRTVSVCAASCLDANVASTAAIVRGHAAVPWLAGQGLPSRLVTADGQVMHLAGWPAEGEELPLASADALMATRENGR
jgi:FAD:protein FMN transferase